MNLVKAATKEKAFRNLFNLYTYELSITSDESLGKYINEDGAYVPPFGLEDYFNGKKDAYVIMENNQSIGFIAFVEGENHLIEEAFIIRAFRKNGIFTSIFNDYIKDKKGELMTHILKGDTYSQNLFEKLFKERNLSFRKEERDEIAWNYFVQL